MPGPPPKRSTERRRRNLEGRPEVAKVPPATRGPALEKGHGLHPLAVKWYNALRRSGQGVYFEPSDWMQARIVAEALDTWLQGGRVVLEDGVEIGRHRRGHSTSLQTALQAMTGLMVTEGERRKLRLELERDAGPKVDPAEAARQAYGGSLAAVS